MPYLLLHSIDLRNYKSRFSAHGKRMLYKNQDNIFHLPSNLQETRSLNRHLLPSLRTSISNKQYSYDNHSK